MDDGSKHISNALCTNLHHAFVPCVEFKLISIQVACNVTQIELNFHKSTHFFHHFILTNNAQEEEIQVNGMCTLSSSHAREYHEQ
jgi:hypothetical protein